MNNFQQVDELDVCSECRLQGTLFATAAAQVSQLEADRVQAQLLAALPCLALLAHQGFATLCEEVMLRVFASGLELDGQPAERVC